jgi:hypothetical protein
MDTSNRPFSGFSLAELERISRSEYMSRDRLAVLQLELLARPEESGEAILTGVRERLYGTVSAPTDSVPPAIANTTQVRNAAATSTEAPNSTTSSNAVTMAFRAVGIVASCVLAYVNASYVHQIWVDARGQGANLWVMVLTLLIVGTPLIFPLTLVGTIAPGIALWNPEGRAIRTLFIGACAFALGPVFAQLPWAAWGFLVLFMK